MDKITIYYCKKHNEWWSSNCSNCMVDDNEAGIRADERTKTLKKVAEWIEKNYFTGEYPTSHKLWLYKEALKKGEIPWTKK